MKRSEMVRDLASYVGTMTIDHNTTNEHTLKEADWLLKMIEKSGMLPPIRGSKCAFRTVYEEIDPTWEPEDE
jgi:hypothetical protein